MHPDISKERGLLVPVIAPAVLALFAGCGVPQTLQVQVDGSPPVFSFDGAVDVLSVYTFDDGTPCPAIWGDGASPRTVWSIRCPAERNCIDSPVTFDVLPDGTSADLEETRPLETGLPTCVAVGRLLDGAIPAIEGGTTRFVP